MKRVFEFIDSLPQAFYDLLGYPTIKMYSDFSEVYFDCYSTIKSFEFLTRGSSICDSFRCYAGDGCITFVFVFNYDE